MRSIQAPVAYNVTLGSAEVRSLLIRSWYTLGCFLRETRIVSFGRGTTRNKGYFTVLVSICIKLMFNSLFYFLDENFLGGVELISFTEINLERLTIIL